MSLASYIRFLFSGKILTLQFFVSALVVFFNCICAVLSSVSLIVLELGIKDAKLILGPASLKTKLE